MLTITANDIVEAMESLGDCYTLVMADWYSCDGGDIKVCAFGALACADHIEHTFGADEEEDDIDSTIEDWATTNYGTHYTNGFVCGFDKRAIGAIDTFTTYVEPEFRRGYWDGWVASLELQPTRWN